MSYIKLDRKLLKWEWIEDPNVVALWIFVLLNANYKAVTWRNATYEPGSFPTSLQKLAVGTGMSVQQIRTALKKLQSTSEITCETTNQGMKIIVQKWAEYQGCDDDNNTQTTLEPTREATRQATTIKEDKNNKNTNNTYRFQKPTIEDVRAYCQERNNNVDPNQWMDYYESNGWKVGRNPMKDWKACVRNWENNRKGQGSKREDIIPFYDTSKNPEFNEDEFNRIMREREEKHGNLPH